MQKSTTYLSSYEVGEFSLSVYRITTFDGCQPKVYDFFVDISKGFYRDPYELRHFKSRQGAERFAQRFIRRNQ